MTRNKNRIYMGYYARSGHDDYHTAILISPKNPKYDLPGTWRLHVVDLPNPNGSTYWEYRALLVDNCTRV